MLLDRADAICENLELGFDDCAFGAAAMIGVYLADSRSSTFLARA